jgi:hypothetical protein
MWNYLMYSLSSRMMKKRKHATDAFRMLEVCVSTDSSTQGTNLSDVLYVINVVLNIVIL